MPNHNPNTTRFDALCALLSQHQPLWQAHAFTAGQPQWTKAHTALNRDLLALSDRELAQLDATPTVLYSWLSRYIEGFDTLPSLLSFPAALTTALLPERLGVGIPGRKWQQIQHFAQACTAHGNSWVDWCSGKGHLGRHLHDAFNQAVRCIEYDAALVASGRELTRGRTICFEHTDVLSTAAPVALKPSEQIAALHACGDLHLELLQQVIAQRPAAVSLAPCCYQKTQHTHYQLRSKRALTKPLELTRQDLHTAVQESVTAGSAVRQRRSELQAWRLGFDALQREISGTDQYRSTPSLPQSALQLGFEGFCRKLAAHCSLPLQGEINWEHYQMIGERTFARASRWDLVRKGFRRALESYLVLDMALWLEEAGYHCEINQFCTRELTPRNLLLQAWR